MAPRLTDLLQDAYPVIAHVPLSKGPVAFKAWRSPRYPDHFAISMDVHELGETVIEHVSEEDMDHWCSMFRGAGWLDRAGMSSSTVIAEVKRACAVWPEIGELMFSFLSGPVRPVRHCGHLRLPVKANGHWLWVHAVTFDGLCKGAHEMAKVLLAAYDREPRPCGLCRGAWPLLCGCGPLYIPWPPHQAASYSSAAAGQPQASPLAGEACALRKLSPHRDP